MIRRFFAPVARLLDLLRYSRKFLLISLLFAFPLALMLLQFLAETQRQVDFSRNEIRGVNYLRQLHQVQDATIRGWLVADLTQINNASTSIQIQQNLVRLRVELDALMTLDGQLGAGLKTQT